MDELDRVRILQVLLELGLRGKIAVFVIEINFKQGVRNQQVVVYGPVSISWGWV